jgi:hypothetical protein
VVCQGVAVRGEDPPVLGWTGLSLHERGPGECHRNQIDPDAGEWCVTLWRMDVNPLSPMRARRVEP